MNTCNAILNDNANMFAINSTHTVYLNKINTLAFAVRGAIITII